MSSFQMPQNLAGDFHSHDFKFSTYGYFSLQEKRLHSNVREALAVSIGLMASIRQTKEWPESILIKMDNTPTIRYINKLGGRSRNMERSLKPVLLFLTQRGIKISAQHILGSDNTEADSRVYTGTIKIGLFYLFGSTG